MNTEKLSYEADLLIGWRSGLGLPCAFYDLPIDTALIMLAMQNEAKEMGLW